MDLLLCCPGVPVIELCAVVLSYSFVVIFSNSG